MTWPFALGGAISLLLSTLMIGAPVFVGFLILNLAGVMVLIGERGFGLFTNSLLETATSPTLATIAIFVLMGEILFRSGAVAVLFDSVDRLVGRLPGRLYIVTVLLSTVFGALSGSAVAVAAMLGRALMPMMIARGYSKVLSASTILSGASLAPIIPPSLFAIIIGSLADVSIAGLLVAGIIPGIILALITLMFVVLRVFRGAEAGNVTHHQNNAVIRDSSPSMSEAHSGINKPQSVLHALLNMAPFGIVVFSVMGLILLGIATPSESAATGVVGACVTAIIFRRFSRKMIYESLLSAAAISTGILLIVCSAKLFSQLLSFTGATRGIVETVTMLGLGPEATFLIMMLIPFILCMFIDQVAFMLMAIPIYVPIVAAVGFDPIWFWTLFLINLTIGSLTPPFGYTLFALKGASPELSTGEVFRAAWPIVCIYLAGIALFWAFPGLVTWIPSLLFS
ncbi:MAG: TRAP transporter large permease [Sneathiella sp.]